MLFVLKCEKTRCVYVKLKTQKNETKKKPLKLFDQQRDQIAQR